MRKSVIISIVYPPTTPAFSHPSFPEGGELEILYVLHIPTQEGMHYDPKKTVAYNKHWMID